MISDSQTIGVAVQVLALLLALRKWDRERQKDRLDQVERFTRVETKVGILFNFWEQKMERRSARDEQAWIEKQAAKARMAVPD